jgi:hypothetical protein
MSPISSSTLEESISAALVKYTKLTQTDLVKHPLATTIQRCDSNTAIYLVLQQHAQAVSDRPKFTKCLREIVNDLDSLSTIPALNKVASLQVVSLKRSYISCHGLIMIHFLDITTCKICLLCAQCTSCQCSDGAYLVISNRLSQVVMPNLLGCQEGCY